MKNKRVFAVLYRTVKDYQLRDRRRGWWCLPIIVLPTDTVEHVVLQFVATKVKLLLVLTSLCETHKEFLLRCIASTWSTVPASRQVS